MQFICRLWSHAREALTRLRASLLPLDTLDRQERRDLRAWIAALEAFVRRIVLLEALSFLDRGSSDALEGGGTNAGLKTRGPRKPRLRLWPRPVRHRARIVLLGPPTSMREIWRNQRRDALIARLKAARGRRRKPHIILADRIDALESILAAPMRAARRLARKLAQLPRLAMKLAFAITRPVRGVDDAIPHEAHSAAVRLVLNSS